MSSRIDLLGPLADLAAALTGAGITAAVNIEDVSTPGVWVTTSSVALERLGGYTIAARLVLIVEDGDATSVLSALSELTNDVLALVDAHDDLTPISVQPQWSASPLPALSIPHNLMCDYLPEGDDIP